MAALTYSIPEAADALGISSWLAYRLVSTGELPSVPMGPRRRVVPKTALDMFLERAVTQTGPTVTPAADGPVCEAAG